MKTTSWHRGLFLSLRTHPSPPTPPDPRRSGLFTIKNCIKIDTTLAFLSIYLCLLSSSEGIV
ncbi:hypothetical protein ES332_A12G067700v1 [Gossypium tomentosum]|uniref:Uncharacterized protein n=1 Tax=Gossypium tomentosum TaxID=34277 RepID=A0A5D2MTG8_GOSTO|nr:hypothetical protein ES332_A12G067700v1 [Gossypium tomentosum]